MSRHRRSKFNALTPEAGNQVRDQAEKYAKAGGRPDMKADGIEGREAALQPMRNDGAAEEGLRQKDVRASHPSGGGAKNTNAQAYRPNRGVSPIQDDDGLFNGLVEKVAGKLKTRKAAPGRRLFGPRS